MLLPESLLHRLENLKERFRARRSRYLLAFITSSFAVVLKLLFNQYIGFETPTLLFAIPITISSWYGGFKPGLFATMLCVTATGFFFTGPIGFQYTYESWFRSFVFIIEGTLISLISEARRNAEKRKDEFMSIASHELKTPVTSIKAFNQILQKRIQKLENKELNSYLVKTETQIKRLTELVSDLLDVNKIQTGEFHFNVTRFDIDELVSEIAETVALTTDTHKIEVEARSEIDVKADRERIGQVVENLISNAIKYSPGEDKVSVKTAANDNHVIVTIKDYGIGIPRENQKKIFERYFRGLNVAHGETYGGMGLGLYICTEIIKRHKGQIWVESASGLGSTFRFTLPLKS